MITFRQLEVFAEVVRCDAGVTQAAARLYVSQPSVSDTIRALEKTLDTRLFAGRGKARALTPAGTVYWDYTQRILRMINESVQAVADLADHPRGRLSIVAVPTAGEHLVPHVLRSFVEAYPHVNVNLMVANRADATEVLRDGSADLAVMGRAPASINSNSRQFGENLLRVVCSAGHALAASSVDLQKIASTSFLLREEGSGTRAAIEEIFEAEGLELKDTMVLGSNSAIVAALREGLGVAIMPEIVVADCIETGEIVELKVPSFPLMREWHLVRLSERHPSAPTSAFMAMMCDQSAAD